jgi:hypothetical protein
MRHRVRSGDAVDAVLNGTRDDDTAFTDEEQRIDPSVVRMTRFERWTNSEVVVVPLGSGV